MTETEGLFLGRASGASKLSRSDPVPISESPKGWYSASSARPSAVSTVLAVAIDGQHQTGIDRLLVENDGATATLADAAAFLGLHELELVPQDLDQGLPRLDLE